MSARLPRRAQWWFELATVADPASAAGHLALGQSLLAGGADGPVRGVTLDVVEGAQGDPAAARSPLEVAHRLEPASPAPAIALALAHQRLDDTARALELLDRVPTTAETLRARAEIIDAAGRARGAHLQVESEQIVDLRTRSLELRGDPPTRYRLVRHLVLRGDFDQARRAACPDLPDHLHRRWREVLDDRDLAARVNDDWLYVVAAEFLDRGEMQLVRRTKCAIARSIVDRPLPACAPASTVAGRARAISYSSGETAALADLRARRPRLATESERFTIDKLEADLQLSLGDAQPLASMRTRLAGVNTEADRHFDDLIAGSRVVVVGPSAFGTFSPSELDAFDVIVSTKRPIVTPSRRPTISYRSDTNVMFDLLPSLERDDDHATIEVIRPSMLANCAEVPDHPALRVMPAEDNNTFLGTRFGLQRILYDLVGRGAATVALAGADFFLSPAVYVAGYDDEMTRIYEPNALQPIRSRAPHDHGWDFRFTKLLTRHGLVDPHPDIGRLLELTLDEYLEQLTAIAIGRPRDSMLLR